MVFLDVVYNHFGPDGNYLPLYAKRFFRTTRHTPWGAAIDFRVPEVRRFFAENALYWLIEFRFDGLRFDAVHAIARRRLAGPNWPREIRASEPAAATFIWCWRTRTTTPAICAHGFDAQWNDDIHHVLHVLLTGETQRLLRRTSPSDPAAQLARALARRLRLSGRAFAEPQGAPRGEPSADLPPTAFVAFLQNHDQIGNRAFGERLTTLADPRGAEGGDRRCCCCCPQIPLIFMGEEIGVARRRSSTSPITTGRSWPRRCARAGGRSSRNSPRLPIRRSGHQIPDPNAGRDLRALAAAEARDRRSGGALYRRPAGAPPRADRPASKARVAVDAQARSATRRCSPRWRLGDGSTLTIASNLGDEAGRLRRCRQPTVRSGASRRRTACRPSPRWLLDRCAMSDGR